MTSTPATVGHIVQHAPVDIMVIEDMDLLKKMLHNNDHLKNVKAFLTINGEADTSVVPNVFKFSDIVEIGKGIPDSVQSAREEMQAVNKACMFIYTSGTTGPPKGALISHDNITYASRVSMEHYQLNEGKEVGLSYLPLSHVAACLIDCYMALHVGVEIHFADNEALKGTLVSYEF